MAAPGNEKPAAEAPGRVERDAVERVHSVDVRERVHVATGIDAKHAPRRLQLQDEEVVARERASGAGHREPTRQREVGLLTAGPGVPGRELQPGLRRRTG